MRRRILLMLGTFVAVFSVSATAYAAWSSMSNGSGTARTGTLAAPTNVAASSTAGSSTVAVSWKAPGGTPAPSSYYIVRVTDGTNATAPACGTSATSPTSTLSCNDTSVADGSYRYVVTGVYHSWTATSAQSNLVAVSTPSKLAFGVQPSNASAGTAISPAVTVAVENAAGDPVKLAGVQVTLALDANPGSGTLLGGTASTDSTGVATFGSLSIDKAASGYTLSASSNGLTGVTSNAFAVTAGVAKQFVFTSSPVSGPAWASANVGPITVQELDAAGNPVPAPVGGQVVQLASSSAGTTRFATSANGTTVTSVTIPAGLSSVAFYYGDTTVGTPTITASGLSINATQAETITAVKLCFKMGSACAADPTQIAKNQSVSLVVSLVDATNNPVAAPTTMSVTISANAGTVTLPQGQATLSIAAGQSTTSSFTYTPPSGNGKHGTLTATATSATGTITLDAA